MTELSPEIWNNPTLGAAANNERLDRLEKQQLENRNAKLEGREPREVVVDNNYPGWEPMRNRPSHAEVVHFADEGEHEIPAPGGAPHTSETERTTNEKLGRNVSSTPSTEKKSSTSSTKKG